MTGTIATDVWQSIGMWLSDNIVNIISAISASLSALCALQANKNAAESQRRADEANQETDRLQAELHRIRDYFDASEQYGKVNERIIDFNQKLSRLSVIGQSEQKSDDDKKIAFYDALNSYEALFNELNSLSALINNGTIKAESYLINTGIPVMKGYSFIQSGAFASLAKFSEKLGLGVLRQPGFGAFCEYDRFLREHMTAQEYAEVQEKRRKEGLRI